MGKIRVLFKKIRDTKGTFPSNMGIIKERDSIDLMEAEDIKKRWQEYTKELYKNALAGRFFTTEPSVKPRVAIYHFLILILFLLTSLPFLYCKMFQACRTAQRRV